jgi:hypothetical protein
MAVLDLCPNRGVGTLPAEIVMRRVDGRAELSVLRRCRVTKGSIFSARRRAWYADPVPP